MLRNRNVKPYTANLYAMFNEGDPFQVQYPLLAPAFSALIGGLQSKFTFSEFSYILGVTFSSTMENSNTDTMACCIALGNPPPSIWLPSAKDVLITHFAGQQYFTAPNAFRTAKTSSIGFGGLTDADSLIEMQPQESIGLYFGAGGLFPNPSQSGNCFATVYYITRNDYERVTAQGCCK